MHPRISVNALCFPGSSLAQVSDHWRTLEARRVSVVSLPLLEPGGREAAKAALEGFALETISHPFHMGHHLDPDPATWAEPRETLSRLIEFAKDLGGRSIYMVSGGRGRMGFEEAAEVYAAALAPCLPEAKAAGIPLAVENAPALYPDSSLCHTLRDALTLAQVAGIGVCYEIFAGWTEAGLHDTIRRAMPICPIIQVSDYVFGDRALPCRAVPGDGVIPLERLLGWALEAGYQGAFDLELLGPRIDREGHLAATRRAADALGEILTRLGA